MPQFKIHFSIEEARAVLPEIRRRFERIHELVAEIRREQVANESERLRIMRGNGKGPILTGISPLIAQIQEQIDEIVKSGIQIKDLERGLIDFPHFHGGQASHEVFLCYELSESDITHWHEIDDGYGGRQPL